MRWLSRAGLLVLCCLLMACGPSRQDGLRQWMQEQRKAGVPRARDLAAPQAFKHLPYAQGERKDPFTKHSSRALANAQAEPANSDLSPSQKSRARQPLEEFALESMHFVGMLEKQGRYVALVRANGILHQVVPGQYIGKNLGKVWRVDESGIALRESAQDADGNWLERNAYLRLQGGN
jgi:type IV pilus assembly protein PilP